MKKTLTIFLLAVSAFAANAPSGADQEINAVIETWKQAMLKGDAATLEKLYSKDLTYEHSSGKVETKAESIANATKPDSISKGIVFQHPTTRIYGNTAVFRSRGDFTTHAGEVHHLDVLMVWIKSGSGWQLVARQSTTVP
jgi:ketosteroid isomerase-like protein